MRQSVPLYTHRSYVVCAHQYANHNRRFSAGTRWCSVTILKPILGAATEHISTEHRAVCIVFNASMSAPQPADTRQIAVSFLGAVGSEPLCVACFCLEYFLKVSTTNRIGHILVIRGGDAHAPMSASGAGDEVMLANNSNYSCMVTNMLDTIQCPPAQQIPVSVVEDGSIVVQTFHFQLHLHKVNNRPLMLHMGECVIEVQLHSNASTAAMMRAHS